jgi:hypothetical protein
LVVTSERISRRSQVHPNFPVANLYREHGYVVRPLVESATTGQVETGVVPVAGENALLDGAAVKREAHMRAAVVHSIDVVAVVKKRQRVFLDLDD